MPRVNRRQRDTLLSLSLQQSRYRRHSTVPVGSLEIELFSPRASERIELRPAGVIGLAPHGIQPPNTLQPLKRREERPGVDFEDATCNLLNPAGDFEAMHLFQAERFENELVQRALDQVCIWFVHG